MSQCEMCGAEQSSLTTAKVEGAELELCDDCTEFGTEVRTTSSSGSTKYSTSSSDGSSASSSSSSGGSSSSSGGSRRRDMFDNMDEVATDYDERIREAREGQELTQEDLAKELNEKASLIGKLEHGDVLPSDSVKRKLENHLDIVLTEGGGGEDTDWDGGDATTTTLGDVVKRKD